MRVAAGLASVWAASAASRARLVTRGSFGVEYATRGEPYVDLEWVVPSSAAGGASVALVGALDEASELVPAGGEARLDEVLETTVDAPPPV